jgi:NAD(P)-dependent dehydrogenase (short-subunit alcohol dehydrogenase family)
LLENKTAIIYGAGGFIGGAVACGFAREGAIVHLTGRTLAKRPYAQGHGSAPSKGQEESMPYATLNSESPQSRTMTRALSVVQGLLALLFLFAGGMKLILPVEEMTKEMPLPGAFLRFIGVAEVLGGLGLILPGLTGIRPGLTPLAAAGLVIIMIGATVLSAVSGGIVAALFPLVVALLVTFVAYSRWRLER